MCVCVSVAVVLLQLFFHRVFSAHVSRYKRRIHWIPLPIFAVFPRVCGEDCGWLCAGTRSTRHKALGWLFVIDLYMTVRAIAYGVALFLVLYCHNFFDDGLSVRSCAAQLVTLSPEESAAVFVQPCSACG